MNKWTFVLKDSQERIKRLKQDLEAAKEKDQYVISIMPDTQVTYGAKPDAFKVLEDLGIPVPKLPEGFGFAMEGSQLGTIFTCDEATMKAADLVPQLPGRLLAIVRLSKWLEHRIVEQQSIVSMTAEVIAGPSLNGNGPRTVH